MKGILPVLGLIFVTLKLIGKIDWSWWWITAPFWGGAILWIVCFVGYVIYVAGWGSPAEKLNLYRKGILKP